MQKRVTNKLIFVVYLCVFTFYSCDYFSFEKKKTINNSIATFRGKNLFIEDVKELIPKNVSKEDSSLVIKVIIDSWAIQQILLQKAEENNTQKTNSQIQKFVEDYRKSLLINSYKEELIKQELDTAINDSLLIDYYQNNKQNFRLNEEIIQLRYIIFDKELIDKKEVIKSFKNGKIEDLEELMKKQLSFKKLMLNDSTWLSLNKVLKETTFNREELLNNSQLIQKEDSIDLFLAIVKNVLQKNEIAPQQYITENLKQILLHRRKLEVIREIEKILLQDAIKEKQLIYE